MALTSGSYEKHNSLSKETATRNHVKGHMIKTWLTIGTEAPAMLSQSLYFASQKTYRPRDGACVEGSSQSPAWELLFPKHILF